MLYQKWIWFCHSFHEFVGDKFEKWAIFVYNHAKLVVVASLVCSFILAAGFIRFNIYGQRERIFYPQTSPTFKALDRAEKSFNYYIQTEEFLLLSKHNKSVLTRNVFYNALVIHEGLMNISGFKDFCLMTKAEKVCSVNSPLELFNYSADLLINIKSKLIKSFNNRSVVMSNGNTARDNYPRYFGNFQINPVSGEMIASTLRVEYPVMFAKTRARYSKNKIWEQKMISYLTNMRPLLESQGLTLIFNTVRGVDDAVGKNTKDNLFLIVCSIGLMVLFCAVCMTVFGNRVKGHFLLSLSGIVSVVLGIGAGFGLALFMGKPYAGFIGVLPFLILGIGIDDMFIILHQVDVCPLSGADRLGKAMRNAGLSITMTTATDLAAFIIGTVSSFPCIRWFCTYAFLSILFSFVMLLTLFLAFISYDIKRIELNRQDCFPCISGKAQPSNALLGEQEDNSRVTDRVSNFFFFIVIFLLLILLIYIFIMSE